MALPRSDSQALAAFVDALLHRDSRSALMIIGDCMEGGTDIDQFATDAVELLRKTLLAKMSGSVDVFSAEMDETSKKQLAGWMEMAEVGELVFAVETLMAKRREIKSSHPSQLPLELAAVRICERLNSDSGDEKGGSSVGGNLRVSQPRTEYVPRKQAAPVEKNEAPSEEKVVAAEADKDAAAVVAALDHVAAEVAPVKLVDESAEVVDVAVNTAVTTVDRIKEIWKEFVAKAGERNAGLPYILGVGTPIEVVGKNVRIGFDFAFHKDKLNQEKNRRMIEDALGGILGHNVRVEGILLAKKEVPADGELTDSAVAEPAIAAVMGGNILQAFGGRVVE